MHRYKAGGKCRNKEITDTKRKTMKGILNIPGCVLWKREINSFSYIGMTVDQEWATGIQSTHVF